MRTTSEIKDAHLSPVSEKLKEDLGIDWIKIKLPSTVQAALLEYGLIEDPYFADNYEKIQWINKEAWLYRIKIRRKKKLSKLVFHGVDYRYSVIFNGKELAFHEGMFAPFILDISNLPEESEIIVKVHPNLEEERPYIIPPFLGLKKNMRFSMSYGWDFAPKIITIGIWDTVELIETDGAFIYDLKVRGKPNGELNISFALDAPLGEYDAEIRILDDNDVIFESNEKIKLKSYGDTFNFNFKISDIVPWFPWDQGEPKLYTLEVSIIKDENVLDDVKESFGFISIRKKGTSFYINDRKIYLRGVNWVPADSLLRLEKERYEKLLRAIRELNANMIRVWGGGLRERRFFYDLADQLGIMIWQEFPFACEDIEMSKHMMKLIKREAEGIVMYLRNHPSIVLWSGGNEVSYWKHIKLFKLLEKIVKENNPEVPFWPVSPLDGDAHSWYVWHGFMPIYSYRYDQTRLVSEFGLQSVPNIDTLKKFLPKDKIWPPNELWIKHNAELNKHYFYTCLSEPKRVIYRLLLLLEQALIPWFEKVSASFSQRILLKYSKKIGKMNLREFIKKNQFIQALGLKIGIEHSRVNRERYDGSLLWQFNEPWPTICWSIYDYYGGKKLAYHFVKMSFEPLQVFLVKEGRKLIIFLVNDTPNKARGTLMIYRNDKIIMEKTFNVSENSISKMGHIKFSYGFYKTKIITEGRIIRNIYPQEFFYEEFKFINRILVKIFQKGMAIAFGVPSDLVMSNEIS